MKQTELFNQNIKLKKIFIFFNLWDDGGKSGLYRKEFNLDGTLKQIMNYLNAKANEREMNILYFEYKEKRYF